MPWRGKPSRTQKTFTASTEPEPSEPPVTMDTLLEGIGVPQAQAFDPDPWQEEAIAHLRDTDVVVSVPTGSGKTFVAVEEVNKESVFQLFPRPSPKNVE